MSHVLMSFWMLLHPVKAPVSVPPYIWIEDNEGYLAYPDWDYAQLNNDVIKALA